MSVSRRSFIKYGFSGVLSSSSAVFASTSLSLDDRSKTFLLGGGAYRLSAGQAQRFVISSVELGNLGLRLADVSFLPHGIHQNPANLSEFAVFEKKGEGALVYDSASNEVVSDIKPAKGRFFYGHGTYAFGASKILSTETNPSTGEGYIGVRDAKTLAYEGDFPSYGHEPHECKLVDGGKTLLVANAGGVKGEHLPVVSIIDVASAKLLRQIPMVDDAINTGHLAVSKNGSMVVISAPRKGLLKTERGGVSIIPSSSSQPKTLAIPGSIRSRMVGEALSVSISNLTGIAAVTHPTGGMVTFWSVESGQFLRHLDFDSPRGVTLNASETCFVLSFGATANIVQISIPNIAVLENTLIESTFLTGSHIYNPMLSMNELSYPGPLG